MSDYFLRRQIIPLPEPEPEILELYRDTHAFYHEVRRRDAFDQYCLWYTQVAEQHRQELVTMRQELNLMSWFGRNRSKS
jgi:hypothetical protein